MENKEGRGQRDYVEEAFNYAIFAVAMLLLIGGNMVIISRITEISMPWTNEILQGCFVVLVFWGVAFGSKKGMVSVSIIEENLKTNGKQRAYCGIKLFHAICSSIFAIFCTVYSFVVMYTQFSEGEKSLVLKFPTGIITLGVVIGCVLWSFYQIQKAVRLAGAIRSAKSLAKRDAEDA